ncbi:MAG: methyltransferase family protein [Promethearchaeota archaeon]
MTTTTASNTTKPVIRLRYLIPYILIFILVPLGTFLLGTMVDLLLHLPPFPPIPFNIFSGIFVMVGGAVIGIKATRQLREIGRGLPWGEADQRSQSSILLTTGIFAYTRNPMTFGYTLLPAGMGLLFRSLAMTLVIPLIVIIVQIIIIKKREEPNLEHRFGAEYLAYKKRTPFLVPSIRLYFARHRDEQQRS